MGPPPDKDVLMGPPPVPAAQPDSQQKPKEDHEVSEKYRKLKRRYLELEEKHKDTADELLRSGERNVKMREERNVLLDRIIELERQANPNSAAIESQAQPLPPHPTSGAFPRSLMTTRARNSFTANLRQAVAEDDSADQDIDPLLMSRHVGPLARKRAEEEKKERQEEEQREARRTSRRGKAAQAKSKETGIPPSQPLMTFTPTSHHTGPGVQGSGLSVAPAPILVSSTGTRLRIKPPAPPQDHSKASSTGAGLPVSLAHQLQQSPSLESHHPYGRSASPQSSRSFSAEAAREYSPYDHSFRPSDGMSATPGTSNLAAHRYSDVAPRIGGEFSNVERHTGRDRNDSGASDGSHNNGARSVSNGSASGSVTMDVNMHSPLMRSEGGRHGLEPSPRSKASLPPALQSNPYGHLVHTSPLMSPFPALQLPPVPGSSGRTPEVQRHAKPKRLKAHTVTSKTHSIPTVPRDRRGRPMLPLNVGIMTVISLGDVCIREHFHTERYIFPVGYEVTRRYLSTIDPNAEVVYHCTILDGGDGPKFQIVPSDAADRPVIAGTATGAWSNIVKQANQIRNRQHSNSVSGPDFFGLGQNTIKHLIQELPGADRLRDYVWQNFQEGGPLGGRHAAVIPALPEEYDAATPIGPYYPSETDRQRERDRERRESVGADDETGSLNQQIWSPTFQQQQYHQQQITLQPGVTQIVLPPPMTVETLNVQEYKPPIPKESEKRTSRMIVGGGLLPAVLPPAPSLSSIRSHRKRSRSPRSSPSHTRHTRSTSRSGSNSLSQLSVPTQHSPYVAASTTTTAGSPPALPATFASIMHAYPAPPVSPQPSSEPSADAST